MRYTVLPNCVLIVFFSLSKKVTFLVLEPGHQLTKFNTTTRIATCVINLFMKLTFVSKIKCHVITN